MPVGPGAADGQGVWQFGDSDIGTGNRASDLFNKLAASVSTQFALDRGRLTTLEGRGQTWIVATLSDLNNLANAKVGDIAIMTTPGTGIGVLEWQAYAGTGSGLDWHIVDTVMAASRANLNTFIAAVIAIGDLRFSVSALAHDGTQHYTFTSAVGDLRVLSGAVPIVPTIASTGGTVTRDAATGMILFSGAVTVLDWYVASAQLALISNAKYLTVVERYQLAAPSTETLQLLDGVGAVNSSNLYYASYVAQAAGASLIDDRAVATSIATVSGANRNRRLREYTISGLAAARATEMVGTFKESDSGTANRIVGTLAWSHEFSGSALAGMRHTFTGSVITAGEMSIEAHY